MAQRMDSARKFLNGAEEHITKGPEDRLEELRQLRKEVEKRKPSPGYNPQYQLQSIDHEIARLSDWVNRK